MQQARNDSEESDAQTEIGSSWYVYIHCICGSIHVCSLTWH
jgi:hypothetical protein